MAKVGIITDSSSCFPRDLAQEYSVLVMPNHLIIEKKDYRDTIDITTAEFWKRFRELDGRFTTAAISPGEFYQAFTALSETTDSIVCMTLSAKLSATYSTAVQAREMFTQKHPEVMIEIIDSQSSIGGLGYVILEAARAAKNGQTIREVADTAQKMIPKVKYLLILESPKYIVRIGRAPEEANKIPVQSISPIMGVVKGTGLVDMLGAGQNFNAAQQKVAEMIRQYSEPQKPLHIMLHYCENPGEVEELKKLITQKYDCAEIYVSQFSPVVVAALGPSVAVGFYGG